MALGIAHLLNYKMRGRGFFRVAILAPYATSIAAATLVFVQIFNPDYGMINQLLGHFGAGHVQWSTSKWPAQIAISAIVTWRWTGYNALIYLAAMQAVPGDLYEAAELDGASRWRAFWSITVPGIRPALAFTAIAGTVNGLQLFAEPQLFDAGGSAGTGGNDRQFQTLVMYLYEKGFTHLDAGYAAALTWVMFVVCALFALVNYRLVRRFVRSA
jgi:cellobiose transport system permease protein